jgi:hypothetical protein
MGYGRYYWTRTASDDFVTDFGDTVELEAVNSSRLRLGGRLNVSLAEDTVQLYFGAAAEQEFEGKVIGLYASDPISNPPELRGSSGFGEIGLTFTPTDSKKVIINTEVFGYAGHQKGIGGSASLGFNF